jgi:hypothetical protein
MTWVQDAACGGEDKKRKAVVRKMKQRDAFKDPCIYQYEEKYVKKKGARV